MDRLARVRAPLLSLHRSLLEAERLVFEREHGRLSAAGFLEVLVSHPQLAWLAPLTSLLLEADQVLEEAAEEAVDALGSERHQLESVRALLHPDPDGAEFQRRYADVLQRSPDVVLAHGALARALA